MSLKVSDEEMPEGDFELLSEMLARIEGGEIPNVEGLDGFLTAVVISPDLIMPSEYTSVITSGQTEEGDLVFESEQEASSFFGILMNHWNRINRVFQSGEIYMPILLEDEQGISRGNDWAKGFLRGTQLRHAEWTEAAGSEEHGGPFVYLWSLAYEDHPDPEIRSNKEPFAAEHREALISGMIAGVKLLYDYLQKHRSAPEAEFNVHVPYMRSGPKVGRNDPCPCGSGKKFKKCCGATTVH